MRPSRVSLRLQQFGSNQRIGCESAFGFKEDIAEKHWSNPQSPLFSLSVSKQRILRRSVLVMNFMLLSPCRAQPSLDVQRRQLCQTRVELNVHLMYTDVKCTAGAVSGSVKFAMQRHQINKGRRSKIARPSKQHNGKRPRTTFSKESVGGVHIANIQSTAPYLDNTAIATAILTSSVSQKDATSCGSR